MWFDPFALLAACESCESCESSKETEDAPPANLANSANLHAAAEDEPSELAKLSKLAAALFPETLDEKPQESQKSQPLDSCIACVHHRAPGLGNRYCTGRQDLPLAYGLLHRLPLDLGDSCQSFRLNPAFSH